MASAGLTRPRLRVITADEGPRRPAGGARGDRSIALLLSTTAVLTLIGLVMVLSASSVSSYARYGSSFLFFKRQLAFALVGAVGLAFEIGRAHV